MEIYLNGSLYYRENNGIRHIQTTQNFTEHLQVKLANNTQMWKHKLKFELIFLKTTQTG